MDDTSSPELNHDLNKNAIAIFESTGKTWIWFVCQMSSKFTEMDRERMFTEKSRLQRNMKKVGFQVGEKYKY